MSSRYPPEGAIAGSGFFSPTAPILSAGNVVKQEFEPRPGVRFTVTTVENGYVLEVRDQSVYDSGRTLIAQNVEQVRDLITAELVKAKLA